jgi:hypothetical protein
MSHAELIALVAERDAEIARLRDSLSKALILGDELADAVTVRIAGGFVADETSKLHAWDEFSFCEARGALEAKP